jgi:hypothetical protein
MVGGGQRRATLTVALEHGGAVTIGVADGTLKFAYEDKASHRATENTEIAKTQRAPFSWFGGPVICVARRRRRRVRAQSGPVFSVSSVSRWPG